MHLFRFEDCWAKDGRCEDKVKRIWGSNNLPCEDKLGALKSFDAEFKEYRTSEVRKEILRTEEMLKNKALWSGDEESIRRHEDLEKRHDELLQTEEILWR